VTDWTVLAAALADELTAAGKLRSPEWQAALRAVPRHELVPVHYAMDPHTGAWGAACTADDLPQVYSNTALFVLPGGLSSTSMPGLMTRMLETLDIHDGHRVLEIGAGTGYNAALLSHRLGDEQVFAVDIETELVELARERLARLGYHPTLVAADGAHGLPEHAPYDRIIVTCSVPTVPWAWVQQTREGGLILVDVKIGQQAGNLVLLQRRGDTAEGRFDPTYGSFMGIRRAGDACRPARSPAAPQHRDAVQQRTTTLDLTRPWEQTAFWFFAHTALPLGTSFSLRGEGPHQPPRNTVLHAPDGSWCEVREDRESAGTRAVWETGPHKLWQIIEDTHAQWRQLGRPGWERFGLTVTPSRQSIWLDISDSEHTWPLYREGLGPGARLPPQPARSTAPHGPATQIHQG
jgi:protein-L-isoaspartate(D-aspartate) O-methyltransferase